MSEYITRDSGERQDFNSGARRDISTGKTRPDLISPKARKRWGDLMARGAEKYGANNWTLGMPMTRFLESAHRHLLAYELGDRGEDHLSAVLFNIGAMIHFEGTEWDDINEKPQPTMKTLYEQIELQPEPERGSMINWDKLRKDVAEGKLDGDTVKWAPGQAPTER